MTALPDIYYEVDAKCTFCGDEFAGDEREPSELCRECAVRGICDCGLRLNADGLDWCEVCDRCTENDGCDDCVARKVEHVEGVRGQMKEDGR